MGFCTVGCSPCNGCCQPLCDPLTSRCPVCTQSILWCCSISKPPLPDQLPPPAAAQEHQQGGLRHAVPEAGDEVGRGDSPAADAGFLMCHPVCSIASLVALHLCGSFTRIVRLSLLLLRLTHNSDHVRACPAHAAPAPSCALQDVFGLEYDLDLFNIVAVDDFNMGAMVRAPGQPAIRCRHRHT